MARKSISDAVSIVKMRSGLTLPPYGYVNADYQWDEDSRRVPEGFLLNGAAATPREWEEYVQQQVNEIAEFLWPRYDQAAGTWRGRAATHAMRMTLKDFEMMVELRKKIADSPRVHGKTIDKTHKALFVAEDIRDPASPLAIPTLPDYLPMVPAEIVLKMREDVTKRLVQLGPAQLRYKKELQRPRPFQVAFMLGQPFTLEFAKSSMTPAMISGHCYQSYITRTGAYLAFRHPLENWTGAVESMQQYTADIGDRRVFAGVHYPSDNISSWFCALRMCDNMYSEVGEVAKEFMRGALMKSAVFAAIVEDIREDSKSVYAAPMAYLQNEMARPANRTDH